LPMGKLLLSSLKETNLTFLVFKPNQSAMNKFDHKWIMYHELHHRHRNGMTPPQIASFMGMDTRTVKKLLEMSEQEYLDFQQHLSTRSKKLAP